MAKQITLSDILGLSISERIQLIEDAWDSITKVPEELHLSEEQKKELDNRINAYHQNPNAGSPWKEIRENIIKYK
ncbi:MAG: addiction module protein [Elusimicrobia bacterium]|nr:addiction module protein [Elusimicrobiota bacterium]